MPFRDTHEITKLVKMFNDFLNNCNDSDSAVVKRFQKKSLYEMCRHLEYFCEPRVSSAAAKAAKGIDLRTVEYKDITTLPKNPLDGKGLLHWDHIEPVEQLRQRMIKARHSNHDIKNVILSADIAWILKTENAKLPKTNRPDARKSYKDAGIEIDWGT